MSIAALLAVAGCSTASSSSSATSSTTTSPSRPSTVGHSGGVAGDMVRRACAAPAPPAVTKVIDTPKPGFTNYQFGPSCVWYATAGTHADSALARAITIASYAQWHAANPVTEQITIGGYPAVRGSLHGGCMVLVNVNDVPLDIELTSVTDPGCATTTALANTVVGFR